MDGKWYKKNRDGTYHKVDNEILTIKFKTDNIDDFLSKHSLSVVRRSMNGYWDLKAAKNSSILEIAEEILEDAPIVESIDVNTYGEYAFSPNDNQFANQWYLNTIGMPTVWIN